MAGEDRERESGMKCSWREARVGQAKPRGKCSGFQILFQKQPESQETMPCVDLHFVRIRLANLCRRVGREGKGRGEAGREMAASAEVRGVSWEVGRGGWDGEVWGVGLTSPPGWRGQGTGRLRDPLVI